MKPKYIYKFQTFTQDSLRNLKNAQIYFSKPIDFNDPFDCAVTKDAISYTKIELLDLINSYIREGRTPRKEEFKKIQDVPPELLHAVQSSISSIAEQQHDVSLHQIGCCCFSESMEHLLMWSHYASGHRGFCLEFDTSFKPFDANLFKVRYSNQYPKWKVASIATNAHEGFSENDICHLLHKYETWKYEKEWRIFHREPNKLFGYDVKSLRAVYFGLSATFTDIEIACLILLGQNPDIKFYRATRHEQPFRLKFDQFTYTQHKDIK